MATIPALSSPGIGSGLNVNDIVTKLMTVESAPLATYDAKTAAFQAKLTAYGKLSSAIGVFQGSLSSLSTPANFRSISANASDPAVVSATATSLAVPGNYNINVTQLAQSQTLTSSGLASTTASIGLGGATTLSFQLGAVTGGAFGVTGTGLGNGVIAGGVSNGSLNINGTAITTDGTTRSARALADAINAKTLTTGVVATAAPTSTSATLFGGFGDIATDAAGGYTLSVGGVQIATQGANVAGGAGVTAASIDLALSTPGAVSDALTAANITVSGTAAAGTLKFTRPDGSNITVSEATSGATSGGIGHASGVANGGSSVTTASSISLSSNGASPITVGGSDPTIAGLTAGTAGSYSGASFAQDGTQATGSIVIDSSNNSLQGIRDAINKAGLGVTASIVSDGSAMPNHLVLSSTKTGASSSIKLSLSGSGAAPADAALSALLAYDPTGTQNLTQNTAAQSTKLTVNGIQINSADNNVTGAIQGVTLAVGKIGSTNLIVAKDSSAVKTGITAFVKAYNDLNKSIHDMTAYNSDTKTGAVLMGDSTTQSIQSQLRRQLGAPITGLTGNLSTISQIGISFQKDGSLTLDSTKLQTAISDNFADIGGLFAALGTATDNQVTFTSSSIATKPGSYGLTVTQMASQGSLSSIAPLATTTIANDTKWSVTLNQTTPATAANTATVTIPAGTYTPSALATLLQSSINGASAFSKLGSTVTAAIDATGKLSVNSSRYGSVSNIALASQSGTPISDLFGAAVPVAGNDVAGTLGGQAVTGSGQTLTGAAGSAADGLKIQITGGAVGDRGTVSFSQGYAYQLNNLSTSFMGTNGLISNKSVGINSSIKDLAKQSDTFSQKLTGIEARYRAQYTRLDVVMASMQTTTTFLTQQLSAIAKNN
ncbi:flagellar filament capping protein FliD [Janthinobacterium sp.]|uniref:flagellar filament capping protein FliD n=1 Tax=Janthinobacterium sp. TaxID=1871054 RepID=UPI00293D6AAD|nr:flagellar filament capping protein FliD [Janthinobacterium sp.]